LIQVVHRLRSGIVGSLFHGIQIVGNRVEWAWRGFHTKTTTGEDDENQRKTSGGEREWISRCPPSQMEHRCSHQLSHTIPLMFRHNRRDLSRSSRSERSVRSLREEVARYPSGKGGPATLNMSCTAHLHPSPTQSKQSHPTLGTSTVCFFCFFCINV